jgi:phosphoglycerate dehydrogenase-like enzyme
MTRVAALAHEGDELFSGYSRDLSDAEVIVVAPRSNRELRNVWHQAKGVRWVHSLSAGVENLLFPELIESDVVVTNGRGIFAPALGEWALAAILHFAKDIPRAMRQRTWQPFHVERVKGQTVGIVGYGSIGKAVAERCAALGMRVLPFSRHQGSLDEALACDYVVVCAPLTESTRGLVDPRRMKRGAVLINIGRGPVVSEPALLEALRGHLRGAALDVFDTEPLPPTHPLWTFDNVLIFPHSADRTRDSHQRAMECFLDNLARYEHGEMLVNVVDKTAGY